MAYSSQESSLHERKAHFRGSALINIKHLTFEDDRVPGTRPLDEKHVAWLVQVFELEGCDRSEEDHHIPAIVSKTTLSDALKRSSIPEDTLLKHDEPSRLRFDDKVRLTCLCGRHRIAAADEFLLPGDKLWVIDLFDDGISESTLSYLREKYSNTRNFRDGDIYRTLRHYQKNNMKAGACKWLTKLSPSKRRDFKQLHEKAGPLGEAFDELLPIIGLWSSVQLGAMHRILTLRCTEELIEYLTHIRVVWGSILDNAELLPLVDSNTVSLLQTKFPKHSPQDGMLIKQLMDNRELFPAITEETIRTRILNRLLSLNCMVPSLYTFFEDTIYIEACAQVLRGLLPKKYKGTMRVAIMRRYKGIGQEEGKAKVQISEDVHDEFVETLASELECIKSGYYQLWLFAMRHWPELTGILPRKDPGAPKPKSGGSAEKWWPRLGLLAHQLGFDSPEITRLRVQSPDWMIADSFLHRARPRDIYQLDGEAHNRVVQGICNLIKLIEPKEAHRSLPKLTSDANEAPP
ncbi:MAG: hypothetical protein M1840_007609 [Geoglossum simile]|nr:MAG: hypothetical protein M1840_007609 [Geoglossum simile]